MEPKEMTKRWRKKLKALRDELLGVKCKICGSNKRLCSHRKDGKPHDYKHSEKTWQMIRDNPEEWIRLCGKCHDAVHWAMKYLDWTWEDIKRELAERGIIV